MSYTHRLAMVLVVFGSLLAKNQSAYAVVTVLSAPSGSTASSEFSPAFAVGNLFDGTVSVADLNSTAYGGTAQYAGSGAGPHNIFLDFGSTIQADGFAYSQRVGGIAAADKVGTIDVWFESTDPGTTLPVRAPDRTVSGINTANDGILRTSGLSTVGHGRYVVMRLTGDGGGGNPGGSELRLTFDTDHAIDTPTVSLSDFAGAGKDLSATVMNGHSRFNASGTFNVANAFDGNAGTQWASFGGTEGLLFLDLDLTADAPLGVMIDSMTWQNRPGALDFVQTMEVIFSTDAIFGNGDDVSSGSLNVDGADADTHTFGSPFSAKYVRFQSLTTVAGFNPGAIQIGLTGSINTAPEPSTFILAAMGLVGLGLGRRRRNRR